MKHHSQPKYLDSPREWTYELFLMFVFGFVLATLLWLGVWFLHGRTALAAAQEQKETAVEAATAEKAACLEAKKTIASAKEEADRQLEVTLRQLKEARLGWGRCIRNGRTAENSGPR